MSLSWRLFISYIIIITISLILAFVTLTLITRSIQNRVNQARLAGQSQQAAFWINTLYRQGFSTERILSRLNDRSGQEVIHLVFIAPHGVILADTQGSWVGQQVSLPNSDEATPASRVGFFTPPNGQPFMYAVTPVGPPGNRTGYVAAVAPQLSFLAGLLAVLGGGFLVAGLVALIVSVVLGVFIARSIARPLQRMATAATAIAAGDYSRRLPENGSPEIKHVARSFNVMIERVESSQQAMRDFVSNVSHELKTPLTSIQGFSQAITEGATQDETTRRRAAGIIHEEASRMTRLVEDLLDLARIDSGQVVMNKTPLDLAQILASTVDRLLPQAAQKQVELVKKWEASLPAVVGDGDRLAQVFTNLLDNAIRHTPPGGRVTLASYIATGLPRPRRIQPGLVQPEATTTLSIRGDFVGISLADTGPGIPPADLDRIFERFYQVDKSRKRSQGTGLGLAICKEIIEAHGGYIQAESVEGIGTKFTLLLPVIGTEAETAISSRGS